MDYDSLIDAETWEFVRRSEAFAPDDAAPGDIAAQRRAYDAMCRAFHHGRPKGVGTEDRDADGVTVRIYSAGDPTRTVLYLHGGGFALGGLDSHDDICAEICAGTGYRVVAVDYRLAPEHVHPAAFDDAWTAALWVAREWPDGLVLAQASDRVGQLEPAGDGQRVDRRVVHHHLGDADVVDARRDPHAPTF